MRWHAPAPLPDDMGATRSSLAKMVEREPAPHLVRLAIVITATPAVWLAFLLIATKSRPLAYLFAFVAAITLTTLSISAAVRTVKVEAQARTRARSGTDQ